MHSEAKLIFASCSNRKTKLCSILSNFHINTRIHLVYKILAYLTKIAYIVTFDKIIEECSHIIFLLFIY